jgi:O-acetyl-ADP-ribose deacetylase (regulator of RNase III)
MHVWRSMSAPPDGPIWHLVDHDTRLVAAWTEDFRDHPEIEPRCDDFFAVEADAMVSPANSFGIMDGGLDAAIRDRLGASAERNVREAIEREYHGELPVGAALVVPSGDGRWPWLVCAPTMRVPEDVARSLNAYLAFRAVLLAVRRHNAANDPIRRIVCPGLCTGIGRMPPRRCAAQMRVAYRQVLGSAELPTFDEIHRTHRAMHGAE